MGTEKNEYKLNEIDTTQVYVTLWHFFRMYTVNAYKVSDAPIYDIKNVDVIFLDSWWCGFYH